MHDEIFSLTQKKLLSLVKKFSTEFGLVGGTAIALHIGHRRSIDFDLFTLKDFNSENIRKVIRSEHTIETIFVEHPNELTMLVDGVKMTFFQYPFPIEFSTALEGVIYMPDLLTLAAMKAYALGRRAKWKDYVDLFFIFKQFSLSDVVEKTQSIFAGEFNEKLFREQLAYFKDIDYSETVDFLPNHYVSDKEIKDTLLQASLERAPLTSITQKANNKSI
ncbi:MAG: nucleotidyl transferase AbiEii/AbiGii toxin family protein [Candidatus Microgenomates bacterium]|jgi:hypothetical protein